MDLTTVRLTSSLSLLAAALAGGCGAQVADTPSNPPVMLGLSRTQVTVGQEIDIIGGNFLNSPNGHTEVRLDGEYHTKDGPSYPVSMQFRPHWEDGNKLVWAQFGPFQVPFSPTGDELGTFEGTVTAINYPADDPKNGVESAPADVSLEVLPSIIIRDFHPQGTQCAEPSRVILGGFAYQVKAEAIGFTPVNFSYVVYGEPGVSAPRITRKPADGTIGEFGADSDLGFTLPPADMPFYIGTFAVTALDTDGVQHAIGLSYGVHKAIEYINMRTSDVAEIEAPKQVSGCQPGGGTNGRTVTYTETETETRSRTVGVNWNEDFMTQATSTNGGSTSDTYGTSYQISQSNTQGWEMSQASTHGFEGGGEAKFGLFDLVDVGVSGKYMQSMTNTRGVYGSSTHGYSVGRDYSHNDTETWAFSQMQGHTVSQGGMDFWTVSSAESTLQSFQGLILPGEYGVFYRQTTRLSLPGEIVAYNVCGVPTVVGEADMTDFVWAADLATGDTCNPPPESNLPPAECFQAPCGNDQ